LIFKTWLCWQIGRERLLKAQPVLPQEQANHAASRVHPVRKSF
jgi:hypothetical protein